MDKDRIFEEVGKLPEIPADKYPIADDEIWEEDDHGGKFKLTRNFINAPDGTKLSFYTLSASRVLGESRQKIMEDFIGALGEPAQITYDERSALHFLSWLIPTT